MIDSFLPLKQNTNIYIYCYHQALYKYLRRLSIWLYTEIHHAVTGYLIVDYVVTQMDMFVNSVGWWKWAGLYQSLVN